jgi:hypothetical protein
MGDPLPQHLAPIAPALPSFQSIARPFAFAQRSLRASRFFADSRGSPAIHRRA